MQSEEYGTRIIDSYDPKTGKLNIRENNSGGTIIQHILKLVAYNGDHVLMFKIEADDADVFGYFVLN